MNRKLCCVGLCSVLLVLSPWFFRMTTIAFTDLEAAQDQLIAAGYHCTSDRIDGKLSFGFLVTRDPIDWEEVGEMLKASSTAQIWEGKVWVTAVGDNFQLQAVPDVPGARVWGKVVVFGDRKFLDEIEATLRKT